MRLNVIGVLHELTKYIDNSLRLFWQNVMKLNLKGWRVKRTGILVLFKGNWEIRIVKKENEAREIQGTELIIASGKTLWNSKGDFNVNNLRK